jgi:hypothetical protein
MRNWEPACGTERSEREETGNPLAGLSGLSRRSFSEDGSAASANKYLMMHDSLSQFNGFRFGGVHTMSRLKLPAASCRESSKCKEVIPFYCSSLANPAASYGECARPVEFPEGNPIQRGELEHFHRSNPVEAGLRNND